MGLKGRSKAVQTEIFVYDLGVKESSCYAAAAAHVEASFSSRLLNSVEHAAELRKSALESVDQRQGHAACSRS